MTAQFSKLLKRFRKQSLLDRVVVSAFVIASVIYGGTKSTNNVPPRMNAPKRMTASAHVVTEEEIAQGYRIVETTEGGVLQMPPGAVTNDSLRLHGGYEDWFRVMPNGWSFPFRGEQITGVTVLAWGEVRPTPRIRAWPRAMTNNVSFLSDARWNLLGEGDASVFSHAVTTNGSLLLDWHNALAGRDVNSPTNMQMELCADGSFVWRTNDKTQRYVAVSSFDWDGDGLENSVDPDPYVAHTVDCHGTSAEWYAVVCSNVFTCAGVQSGEEIAFKEDVNESAYYFVEVVAEPEAGDVPIYFMADRESRLGSPVVIARAGETNLVPLLIGITYTVTSEVPISVSAPDVEYTEITMTSEKECTIEWPLNFEILGNSDDTGSSYVVNVTPFDPGGEFTWEKFDRDGSALRLRSSSCSCFSGFGNQLSSACSGNCLCGGCFVYGIFSFESALFTFGNIGCVCYNQDSHEEDNPPSGGGGDDKKIGPEVTIEMDQSAIVFEDEYSNDVNVTVPRKTTWAYVKVVFETYDYPASCSVKLTGGTSRAIMHSDSRDGTPCESSTFSMKKHSIMEKKFYIEGISPSSAVNDIKIEAKISGGGTASESKTLTVYEVKVMPQEYKSEILAQRHYIGIGEVLDISVYPETTYSVTSEYGEITRNDIDNNYLHIAPFTEHSYCANIDVDGITQSISLKTFCPREVVVLEPPKGFKGYITTNQAGAVGIRFLLGLSPTNVSFSAIQTQEKTNECSIVSGYFTDKEFISWRPHNVANGAGKWNDGGELNYDIAFIGVCPQPWSDGVLIWYIPNLWRRKGDDTAEEIEFGNIITQEFRIDSMGKVRVKKFNYHIERIGNGNIQ